MLGHDIIVIGASAGGLEALQVLVKGLPSNLPAAVFVVTHMSAASRSVLPSILSRASQLPVAHAVNGEAIETGRLYVSRPDHHLVLERGYVRLTHGPKENRFRPSVDVLFRSAAYAYGPRVAGVVLSGQLDDGTAGLWAIKDRGGIAVVQDPQDAYHAPMPESALRHVAVDHCLPIAEIAPLLVSLAEKPAPLGEEHPATKDLEIETRIAQEANPLEVGVMQLGQPSPYTCPECHGVLLQLQRGNLLRFRCHTGHAFSLSSLLAEVTSSIERTLWSTIRGIDESLFLLQYLARDAEDKNDYTAAALIRHKAREANRRRALVQRAAREHEQLSTDDFSSAADGC